jgi:hypothetical protein
MSDVNAIITAVDKGMDIIDGYEREVEDLRAHVVFDIHSVIVAVEREKSFVEQEMDDLCYSSYEDTEDDSGDKADMLSRQRKMYDSLLYQTSTRGEELESEWRGLCGQTFDLAEDSKRLMADYIRKLNRINYSGGATGYSSSGHGPEYYVVIVDSQKYPQTAEHIKMAQTMGFPEFVTLGRADAAERRKASLSDVKASPIYDRDEWPMAVFEEGGQGADVAYIEGRDNRGAGSSIGWQMRGFPDGSRVRVRVI